MDVGYAALKQRSIAVADAIAAERSARNLSSRRKAIDRADERDKTRDQLDKKRRDDREAEVARRRIRVKVERHDRPKYRGSTPRKLYHRQLDKMLMGTTGLTDARGPDRLYSIHYAFTARGFASRKVRRWRKGEAERAALYGVRHDALEGGERGWWSNIADDRNELAAHYRASEALEKHDRANANVYISEVIALPAELTARQRRRAVRRICRWFEARGLAFVVGIHLPDASGDQRNYHCHIVYSLRPCQRTAPYEWAFAPGKRNDINTPDGIRGRRLAVVRAINATLHAAGIDKRYTHLSNKARNMASPVEGKDGQEVTWARRRLAAMEQRRERLRALSGIVVDVRDAMVDGVAKLDAAYQAIDWALDDRVRDTAVATGDVRLAAMREQVERRLNQARQVVSANIAAGAMQNVRQLATNRLSDMRDQTNDTQNRMATDAVAAHIRDRLARIRAAVTDHVAAGSARVAAVARRIDRARARDDISVAIMEVTTGGALALHDAQTTVGQRMAAMAADLSTGSSSRADATRDAVLRRLGDIRAAVDPRSPDARQVTARLYAAKTRAAEPTPESKAMQAIRTYTPPAKPAQDEGVERNQAPPPATTPESDRMTVEPPAETLSTSTDHALARAMAAERERVGREAAWKRLVKSRAIVTRDGERYTVDMVLLTEAERGLLARAGFADELQQRLQVLFARQSEISAPDAHQVAEDHTALAIQQALQRGQKARE